MVEFTKPAGWAQGARKGFYEIFDIDPKNITTTGKQGKSPRAQLASLIQHGASIREQRALWTTFHNNKKNTDATAEQRDVVIVSGGVMAANAIEAALELASQGLSVKVINVTQLKSITDNPENMREFSKLIHTGSHLVSVIDALPETMAEPINATIVQHRFGNIRSVKALGIKKYGSSGKPAELYHFHGFDREGIVETANSL